MALFSAEEEKFLFRNLGIRRCGKSTLLLQFQNMLLEERIKVINIVDWLLKK